MKRKAFTLWELLAVVAVLAIGMAILFPTGHRARPSAYRSSCNSNLKQIGLGWMQYAADANEKFPNLIVSERWPETLQPYVKSWEIFHCPSVSPKSTGQTSDYFFNARAANLELEKFENVSISILAGDGLAAQKTEAVLTDLPALWISDLSSPAYRHLLSKDSAGAVYLFADGHVKWLRPKQITLDKPALGKPTFLVK